MKRKSIALASTLAAGVIVTLLCVPRGMAIQDDGQEGGNPACAPDAGDCFSANGTPGCEDDVCCNAICDIDPFCCDTEWDQLCADQAIDMCDGAPGCLPPSCGKINVECLNGANPGAYANRTIVGRVGSCTGWIIAEPNIFLTNQHCVGTITPGVTMMEFNYECEDCPGSAAKAVDTYLVTDLLYQNVALDFALYRLAGDPASTWGVAEVNDLPTAVGQAIYEIHHGELLRKGYDEGQVTTPIAPNLCIPGTTAEFGVNAIATGGASGSPIFDANNHSVVGICHCGPPCAPGFGIPMSAIWPIAKTEILNAGGTPNEFCPEDTDNSNTTDVVDLLAVLTAWGPCPPPCPPVCAEDVNCDCVVDVVDLLAVLTAWGPCN